MKKKERLAKEKKIWQINLFSFGKKTKRDEVVSLKKKEKKQVAPKDYIEDGEDESEDDDEDSDEDSEEDPRLPNEGGNANNEEEEFFDSLFNYRQYKNL